MRSYLLVIHFCVIRFCCAQQNESTFRVKKPVATAIATTNAEKPLSDFEWYPGVDTLDVNQVYFVSAVPIIGRYDSVSVSNIRLKIKGTTACIITPKQAGISTLKFYKKDSAGDYLLLYVRRFTIAGGSPYTYQREITMPDW